MRRNTRASVCKVVRETLREVDGANRIQSSFSSGEEIGYALNELQLSYRIISILSREETHCAYFEQHL